MKKLIFTMSALVLMCLSSMADNITADNVNLLPGKTVQLAINMENNERAYTAFWFELELPVGISVTNAVNSNRLSSNFSLTWDKVDNGEPNTYKFYGTEFDTEQSKQEISGTSGTILTLTLSAAETLEVGSTLVAKIKKISATSFEGNETYDFDDYSFTIKISDPWITLDENSTTLPEASDGETQIKVKRTIKANQWNTICLPFAMTETQVYDAFGDDMQLYEFMEYEADENLTEIKVLFDVAHLGEDGFFANYPYIIKTSKDISEFMVTSTIEPDEENAVAEFTNGRTGSRKEVYGTFYGTLKAGGKVPANCLFLNGGDFWYSTGVSNLKAFRGYFEFVDILASIENSNSKIQIVFRDETTGIKNIETYVNDEAIYDLQGRRVVESGKGVYIKKGKKIVIK